MVHPNEAGTENKKMADSKSIDFIVGSSASRTIAAVSTFKGKQETDATIQRLFHRAMNANHTTRK